MQINLNHPFLNGAVTLEVVPDALAAKRIQALRIALDDFNVYDVLVNKTTAEALNDWMLSQSKHIRDNGITAEPPPSAVAAIAALSGPVNTAVTTTTTTTAPAVRQAGIGLAGLVVLGLVIYGIWRYSKR